jgi:hypothetical protein
MMIGSFAASCHLHLLNEDALLHIARRVIVEVVEADLAPGDHVGIAGKALEFVEVRWRGECSFVRMNADRRVDARVFIGEFDGAVERARAGTVAVADGEHRCYAGCLGSSEDISAVGIKALVLEMAVGVGEHWCHG